MSFSYVELIGYIGSFFVLVAFVMTSVVKLRVINSVGCLISVIYGLMIKSYPMVIMNVALLLINLYFLIKISNNKESYKTVECEATSSLMQFFLFKYKQDIEKCFPDFHIDPERCNFAQLILCRDTIVGAQIGTLKGEELQVHMDYSVPSHRDCSVGRYAYEHLIRHGVLTVFLTGNQHPSVTYLKALGFKEKDGRYTLKTF